MRASVGARETGDETDQVASDTSRYHHTERRCHDLGRGKRDNPRVERAAGREDTGVVA